jgi:hypothetical protein
MNGWSYITTPPICCVACTGTVFWQWILRLWSAGVLSVILRWMGTPLYLEGGGSRVSEKISIYLSNCMAWHPGGPFLYRDCIMLNYLQTMFMSVEWNLYVCYISIYKEGLFVLITLFEHDRLYEYSPYYLCMDYLVCRFCMHFFKYQITHIPKPDTYELVVMLSHVWTRL